MTDADPNTIPAATLILFRDGPDGSELLFVERAAAMRFAAGALVFPGGRMDVGDHALAATFDGDPEQNAARIAAIRETIEEAGIAVGLNPMPDGATLDALRAALHEKQSFGAALHDAGLSLDLAALVPFARWWPKNFDHRVFDTHFFIARLPENAPEPIVDATENVRVFWAGARSILDAADADTVRIIFPTRRNLDRLAQFSSFDEAVADAMRHHPIRTVTPWFEDRDDGRHLCIPDDIGYPVTSENMATLKRG